MTKGSIHAQRSRFIKEMIAYGSESVADMIRAYKSSYPSCKKDETARVGGYKLLQIPSVVSAIDKGLQEKEEAIKRARQKEIERLAREQIASETELDAVLSQIATGKRIRKKKVLVFNPIEKKHQTVTIEAEPDLTSMISAADKLYKRKGSYAAAKVQHEAGDSFIDALREMSNRKNKKESNVPA